MTTQNEMHEDTPKPNTEFDELTKIKYMGGHEYDGIKELDNRLPPWLKYLFYASIIFSFAYLMLVFIFEDDSILQEKEYQNEMAAIQQAQEQQDIEAEKVVPIPKTEAQILGEGKNTYDNTCMVCHGKFGQGLVGPNLTDEYWIHGGSMEDMTNIVLNGVIEKGMISYSNQLSKSQIESVLIYIQSLQGTNPSDAKAPDGEKYVPEVAQTPEES